MELLLAITLYSALTYEQRLPFFWRQYIRTVENRLPR